MEFPFLETKDHIFNLSYSNNDPEGFIGKYL